MLQSTPAEKSLRKKGGRVTLSFPPFFLFRHAHPPASFALSPSLLLHVVRRAFALVQGGAPARWVFLVSRGERVPPALSQPPPPPLRTASWPRPPGGEVQQRGAVRLFAGPALAPPMLTSPPFLLRKTAGRGRPHPGQVPRPHPGACCGVRGAGGRGGRGGARGHAHPARFFQGRGRCVPLAPHRHALPPRPAQWAADTRPRCRAGGTGGGEGRGRRGGEGWPPFRGRVGRGGPRPPPKKTPIKITDPPAPPLARSSWRKPRRATFRTSTKRSE
jgi:hypothetical protein